MKQASRRLGRVDLHLHSYASNVTTYYAANAFAIPESYSDPRVLYSLCRERGMSLFTLTDHNSIEGVKQLLDAGVPHVFASSELTCTFPEDGCHVHVTVVNVSEAQFDEANRLRANLYELVAYLEQQIELEPSRPGANRIAYFMTHPLMSTENRAYGREGSLSLAHFEKAQVLLPGFEVRNGSRARALNETTWAALDRLDEQRLARLADRHRLPPRGATPWRKFVTGGSDDHAGINPGHTCTTFPYEGAWPTPNDLVLAMRRRETRPDGAHGGPITLAHSLFKLLYEGSRRAAPGGPTAGSGLRLSTSVEALLQLVFDGESQSVRQRASILALRWRRWLVEHPALRALFGDPQGGLGVPFEVVLEQEVHRLLDDPAVRDQLAAPHGSVDHRIFLVVGTLINRLFVRYADNVRSARSRDVIGVIKELIALLSSNLLVSLPYLAAFLQQGADSLVAKDVRRDLGLEDRPHVALFTDTYFEVNGVSATIRRMQRESLRRGVRFTVFTCVTEAERARVLRDPEVRAFVEQGCLELLTSVTELAMPEYDDLRVRFPPLLEVLRLLEDRGFTKVHVSTPGTVGLTGLAAAKLLGLDTAATYHTSIPEYVEHYTRDIALEDLAWKYMLVFYHAVDEVLVPSRFVAKHLHKRGLRNRKLLLLDRWVDTQRFQPAHRVEGMFDVSDDAERPELTFAYVGRLGVEKNLALVAEAFRRFHGKHPRTRLVLIGDGPYRAELERALVGLPVVFTGFLHGEALARAIASCDVKLFPSTTDTWGNAPLEAQACGLPVIVSDLGGPRELMEPGVTGFAIQGRDPDDLVGAMERLMAPSERARMGAAARAFAVAHRVDEPFTAVFDSDRYRMRLAEAKAGARGVVSLATFDLSSPSFPLVVGGSLQALAAGGEA